LISQYQNFIKIIKKGLKSPKNAKKEVKPSLDKFHYLFGWGEVFLVAKPPKRRRQKQLPYLSHITRACLLARTPDYRGFSRAPRRKQKYSTPFWCAVFLAGAK